MAASTHKGETKQRVGPQSAFSHSHLGMRLEESLKFRPGDIETVDGVIVVTVGKPRTSA